MTGIRRNVVIAGVTALALAACGSSGGSPSGGSPSGEASSIADQSPVYQQDVQTCNEFGAFLMNEINDVPVYDDANGGNGITVLDPEVSPALQALVNEWFNNYEVATGGVPNPGFAGANETTAQANHRVITYTTAIVAWCSAHADVNLTAIPMPSGYP
jgi:hypothetical protein